MLSLFGIVDSKNVPALIKHDAHISMLPLYVSKESASKFLATSASKWPEPEKYKIVEWDGELLKIARDAGKRLGIEIVIRVLD